MRCFSSEVDGNVKHWGERLFKFSIMVYFMFDWVTDAQSGFWKHTHGRMCVWSERFSELQCLLWAMMKFAMCDFWFLGVCAFFCIFITIPVFNKCGFHSPRLPGCLHACFCLCSLGLPPGSPVFSWSGLGVRTIQLAVLTMYDEPVVFLLGKALPGACFVINDERNSTL